MSAQPRSIGKRVASPIAVGSVKVSVFGSDRDRGLQMMCAAFDAGVTVVDTAAAYVPSSRPEDAGHNERLVADAIDAWGGDPSTVTVVTKGGHKRVGDGTSREDFSVCGKADFIREQCEQSLEALRRDRIDLYLLHWPDPDTPIEESMEALVGLQAAGLVDMVGLSNVTVDQLEAASSVGTVSAVQNHFAPRRTFSEPVLRWCEANGAAFMAYSPLGGSFDAGALGEKHPQFKEVAEARSVSPQRVALAWVLAQSPAMIAVVGASRPETILDSVAAVELELTDDELAALSSKR